MRHVSGRFWRSPASSLANVARRAARAAPTALNLFRYLDERMFAFNHRAETDFGRFAPVLSAASGRRLTWLEVTGKLSDEPCCP